MRHDIMLVLYHKRCPDGFAAAAVYYRWAFEKQIEYTILPVGQGWELTEVLKTVEDNDIVLLDLSITSEIYNLLKKFRSYLIIDHHKTGDIPEAKDDPNFIFDINECGATLTWKHYFGCKHPILLDYVKDRDLWLWKQPMSKEVSAALYLFNNPYIKYEGGLCKHLTSDYVPNFNKYQKLLELTDLEEYKKEGVLINQYNQYLINEVMNHVNIINFNDVMVGMVNCNILVSEVGNSICTNYNVQYAIVWRYENTTNLFKISLRSVGYDVSNVAVMFEGGGHARAAAFALTPDKFEVTFNLPTFNRDDYRINKDIIELPSQEIVDKVKYNLINSISKDVMLYGEIATINSLFFEKELEDYIYKKYVCSDVVVWSKGGCQQPPLQTPHANASFFMNPPYEPFLTRPSLRFS